MPGSQIRKEVMEVATSTVKGEALANEIAKEVDKVATEGAE